MNTTRALTFVALTLTGFSASQASDVTPAWRSDVFVMEEVVVIAEGPASYYMEEIVVRAEAPDYLYMEEVVVTATVPTESESVAALETPVASLTSTPVMEEIVVTARREDLPARFAARSQNLRYRRHF